MRPSSGRNVELARRYAFAMETGRIEIRDRVTNRGFRPARHAMLYHVNVGHPVLSETARLTGDGWRLADRLDDGAATPTDDHVEIVDVGPSPDAGRVGISLGLRFDPRALPTTALWRAFQSGTFALGLEPQTGLSDAADATLSPGGARDYALVFTLADLAAEGGLP